MEVFAERFVKKAFRGRLVHEAIRKPDKLMARVCTQIADVFEDHFRNGACVLKPNDQCFLFEMTGRSQEMSWSAATQHMNEYGGGGYLVIEATGHKFYAQSEGFPPPQTYAG
jgi:hypothetical protein